MTDKGEQDINLVHFRIHNLLSAKLHCNQNTFISITKTLSLLDSSQLMQEKIRITRIKDQLRSSEGNVVINYIFMGKVECQLEISLDEAKGREKSKDVFRKLIEDISSGKFGPISECAKIFSRLDPLILSCRGLYN